MRNKKIVILPCAGSGSRFNNAIPKQYTLINEKTILEHTLNVFLSVPEIDQIIVVTAPDDLYIDTLVKLQTHDNIKVLKVGGPTRAHTVKNAVDMLDCQSNDWLLVHDVARCCVSRDSVIHQIQELEYDEVGGILAISALDTIKQSYDGQIINTTLDRNTIYQAQTPQMFRAGVLKGALNMADLNLVTDDASAVEQLGLKVKLIPGERSNIKVTYPIDISIAQILLNSKL